MNPLRMFNIIREEGLNTFRYCIKEKISDRTDDDKRYQTFIKTVEPRLYNGVRLSDAVLVKECRLRQDENGWKIDEIKASKNVRDKQSFEYIGFTPEGTVVDDHALTELAWFIENCQKRGEELDLVYSDEDYIDERGKRCHPDFKGEFSPDTLLSFNYIGGFWCARRDVLEQALQEMDNAEPEVISYELLLRLIFVYKLKARHINRVLLHKTVRNEYNEKQLKLIAEYKAEILKKIGISAEVGGSPSCNQVQHIYYEIKDMPLVSIIIPSKDNPEILNQCINSIKDNTPYTEYEIIVVDNGSSKKNENSYKKILEDCNLKSKYIYEPFEFNFSKMCNIGAKNADGGLYLFLNDDIEILEQNYVQYENQPFRTDWLGVMAGQAMQDSTGAVGVKLLYPKSNRIQHIGVVNYETAYLAHIYSRSVDDSEIKAFRNYADYNYLCLTGACLMVKADKFLRVGGFSEDLAVTHNDIDLCMKLHEIGYLQVQRNDVVLVHHESFSRGDDGIDAKKELRNMKERDILFSKHPQFEKYDPYYSPCLTQLEFQCQINPVVYSVFYVKPNLLDEDKLKAILKAENTNSNRKIVGELTMAEYREDLQLRGYVYISNAKESDYMGTQIIIYNDSYAYLIKANAVCDRTFHMRKNLSEHVNFAPFFAGVDTSEMNKGEYSCILYKKNMFCFKQKNVIIK